MRKIIAGIGSVLMSLGGLTIGIVILYAEWLITRQSFFMFLNPFTQVNAMISALFYPITWVAVGLIALGFVLTLVDPTRETS